MPSRSILIALDQHLLPRAPRVSRPSRPAPDKMKTSTVASLAPLIGAVLAAPPATPNPAVAYASASATAFATVYKSPPSYHSKTHSSAHSKPTGESPSEMKQRADAVKEAFQHAWDGYYKYAFPNDELHPVSNGFSNSRNGWGASAADAFSTALVMSKADIVNEILDYIPKINWSVSYDNEQVSLFETTIRYLGGILSAYDFLTGPRAHLAKNVSTLYLLSNQLSNADSLS